MNKSTLFIVVSRIIFNLSVLLILSACAEQLDQDSSRKRWYSSVQVESGQQVFMSHCAVCHGAQAQGLVDDWRKTLADGSYPPPPLNGTAHAWHHPLPQLLRSINQGGVPLGGKMPAFALVLNDQQKLAAIAYFQHFWSDDIYQKWLQVGGLEE